MGSLGNRLWNSHAWGLLGNAGRIILCGRMGKARFRSNAFCSEVLSWSLEGSGAGVVFRVVPNWGKRSDLYSLHCPVHGLGLLLGTQCDLGWSSFLGPKMFLGGQPGWAGSATNALSSRDNENLSSERVSGQCHPPAIRGPGSFRIQD